MTRSAVIRMFQAGRPRCVPRHRSALRWGEEKNMGHCEIARKASQHIYGWLRRQPRLKEESITDWLLDQISTQTNQIAYYLFDRHEEATMSGADWDWWVLFGPACFKLRIQAKRARENHDHYKDIARSNQMGLQIELLINSSTRSNFYPMYAFYGHGCGRERCTREAQDSGVFVTSALEVYRAIVSVPRRTVPREALLSLCIPFHCLFCCPLVRDRRDHGFQRLFTHYFGYPGQPGENEPNLMPTDSESPGYERQTPRLILSLLESREGENAQGMIREYQSMFPESNGLVITRHNTD